MRLSVSIVVMLVCSLGAHACTSTTQVEPGSAASLRRNGVLVTNESYRVRMHSPGPGWSLVSEYDRRASLPDALSAIRDESRDLVVAVVAEATLTDDLEVLAHLAFDALPLDNRQLASIHRVRYQGHDAIRVHVTAEIGNRPWQAQLLVFVHQEQTFTLSAQGPSQQAGRDGANLTPLFDSVEILDGTIRPVPQEVDVVTAHGDGWRVRDRVFESASFGLRIEPGPAWRTIVGAPRDSENVWAEAIFTAADPYVHVTVLPLWRRGRTEGECIDPLVAGMLETEGSERLGQDLDIDIAGRPASLARVKVNDLLEFAVGGTCFDDLCLGVIAFYPLRAAARSQAFLRSELPAVRRLDATERAQLDETLRTAPDESCHMGAGWAVREASWSSFAHGSSWQQPASGTWRIYGGARASRREPDALLYFEEPARDLKGYLLVHAAAGDETALHRAVLEETHAVVTAAPVPLLLGELKALVSRGTIGALTCLVATIPLSPAGPLQIRVCGHSPADTAGLDEALRGFRFAAAPTAELVTEGDRTTDRQFGWQFEPPPVGWQRNVRTSGDHPAIVRVTTWNNDSWAATVSAVRTDNGDLGGVEAMQRLEEVMVRTTSRNLPSHVVIEGSTLGGIPARHHVLRSPRGDHADIYFASRCGVVYSFAEFADAGAQPGPPAAERFHLIP